MYLNSDLSEQLSETGVKGPSVPSTSPVEVDPARFHENLKVHCFQCLDDVNKYYSENTSKLKAQYGILLFLYTVIASKVNNLFF